MVSIINGVTNVKSSPGLMTGLMADRPPVAPNGMLYVATDTQDIFSYDQLTTSWINVSNGGGGLTPNLLQVTTVGNATTTDINVNGNGNITLDNAASANKLIFVKTNGLAEVAVVNHAGDLRGAAIIKQSAIDSGYLLLVNKNGGQSQIRSTTQGIGVTDIFELPDKNSVPQTIATLSDLGGWLSGQLLAPAQVDINFMDFFLFNSLYTQLIKIPVGTSSIQIGDVPGDVSNTYILCDDAIRTVQINALHTSFTALQNFANNAAAILGGLAVGDMYYTNVAGDGVVKVVL